MSPEWLFYSDWKRRECNLSQDNGTEFERCDHVVLPKVLVVMMMEGVAARRGATMTTIVLTIEVNLKILSKRHVPGITGHRLNRSHLFTLAAPAPHEDLVLVARDRAI